jgi:hypothetical protein
MYEREILTASRLCWHDTPDAYQTEAGGYIALIMLHKEPASQVRTYRVLLAYQSSEHVLAAESFNNLEDAVAWCEWKMPTTFNEPEAHEDPESPDAIDGGNIWDFLRSLGLTF